MVGDLLAGWDGHAGSNLDMVVVVDNVPKEEGRTHQGRSSIIHYIPSCAIFLGSLTEGGQFWAVESGLITADLCMRKRKKCAPSDTLPMNMTLDGTCQAYFFSTVFPNSQYHSKPKAQFKNKLIT